MVTIYPFSMLYSLVGFFAYKPGEIYAMHTGLSYIKISPFFCTN